MLDIELCKKFAISCTGKDINPPLTTCGAAIEVPVCVYVCVCVCVCVREREREREVVKYNVLSQFNFD